MKRGKRYRTERMQTALGYGVLALILAALALMTVSCRTVRIVEQVPVYIHDTTQSVKTQRDSIYIDHFREVVEKGDTVYVTDNQMTVKYITRTDTAYKVAEKPVEVVKEQIKEVEKPLSKLHKFVFSSGLCALLAFFAWLTVRIIRFFRKK